MARVIAGIYCFLGLHVGSWQKCDGLDYFRIRRGVEMTYDAYERKCKRCGKRVYRRGNIVKDIKWHG